MLWPGGFENPCACNPEGMDGAAGNSGLMKAADPVDHVCHASKRLESWTVRQKMFWRGSPGSPGSQNRTIRPPVSQSGPLA